MKITRDRFLLLLVLGCVFIPHLTKAAEPGSSFQAGDLLKGRKSTVYYFGSDGKRYIFPNEKTYFTWYPDFSGVQTIPDADLAAIPLGTDITYRPGSKLLKLESSQQVYAVDRGGILRHVVSEQFAETLYGLNWKNRVEDLPDVFFRDYREGPPIDSSFSYQPASVMTLTTTIAQDKFLPDNTVTVAISSAGFVPSTFTVKPGTHVIWTNQDGELHQVIGDGWSSGVLGTGESFSRTFSNAGSFSYSSYHDTNQQALTGNINVKE